VIGRLRRAFPARITAALAAACGLALACAGGSPARSTAPASPVAGAGEARQQTMPGDPRAEITELDRQITDELARDQLTRPAIASCSGDACTTALAAPFATPTADEPSCHPAAGDHCSDVCKLSTSICHNQDRICELAKSLPGDDWAANKCTSARASCQTAHARCCSCTT
jgi:hypothetical protein